MEMSGGTRHFKMDDTSNVKTPNPSLKPQRDAARSGSRRFICDITFLTGSSVYLTLSQICC
jgi:hypothetical protein